MPDRLFRQPPIDKKSARLEPFSGRAYRFYLLLPRYRAGKEVFSNEDDRLLFQLLTMDFGGCTTVDVEKAPVIGSWESRATDPYRIEKDFHVSYTIYTKPTKASKNYFRHLESNLRKHLLATIRNKRGTDYDRDERGTDHQREKLES